MTPRIIRSLISLSLNKSFSFQKPFSCYSISVVFFSSSTSTKASEVKPSLYLADHFVKKHDFPPELALKAASSVVYAKDSAKSDDIILFLKENGFLKSHLEQAVERRPNFLFCSLENTIKPKFKIFRDFGFSNDDIADILSSDPWILSRSGDKRIAPSMAVLKSVVGSNAGVIKLLRTSAWFLKSDLQKTMMPNIEYMRSCGISSSQIRSYVFSFPRFFLHKPENIKQLVKRADDMGFDRKSNMFIAALRMLSSMSEENWEHKLKVFKRLGFSEDDIMLTFRKTPQVFSVSERKIKEVTEFLLSRRNIDMSFIINQPAVLTYSLEQRLKPRLVIFDILESKKLLRRKLSLTSLFKMSEKRFREKFVRPYLEELEKASVAVVGL